VFRSNFINEAPVVPSGLFSDMRILAVEMALGFLPCEVSTPRKIQAADSSRPAPRLAGNGVRYVY
jgi:hypothetical protein